MTTKPIVCLDSGHGVESSWNQSPDKKLEGREHRIGALQQIIFCP